MRVFEILTLSAFSIKNVKSFLSVDKSYLEM